jgi:uncharacterized membrane protein YozB (DUF420 family)
MYPVFLAAHNIVRWVALVLGILAAVRAWLGWLRKSEWSESDRKIGVFFSSAMDTQLLLGLLLYFLFSPITRAALGNFGAAMRDGGARFFALEHTFYMLLAVVFAHLGSILPRKASEAIAKHRQAAIWFSLAVLLILLGIPWMRPLLPGL